jgi:hypothetical protein
MNVLLWAYPYKSADAARIAPPTGTAKSESVGFGDSALWSGVDLTGRARLR